MKRKGFFLFSLPASGSALQTCSGGLVGGGAAMSAATAHSTTAACMQMQSQIKSESAGGRHADLQRGTNRDLYVYHMPIGSTILDDHQPHHCICLLSCYIEEASLSRKILMITCAPGCGGFGTLARSPPACTALFGCAHNIRDFACTIASLG